MLASNTTRCGRDTANRFPEHVWNELRFPAAGKERRSDLPAEMAVFPPEFERQRSVDAMEDNLVAQRGPSAFRWNFQLVLGNEQVVSLFRPKRAGFESSGLGLTPPVTLGYKKTLRLWNGVHFMPA